MYRRILIITYYWPPAGGAGVQRWLKFVKYLPEFGWKPVVYTVENGEFPEMDYSLEKDIPESVEVIRRKIFEPYHWYKKFIGQKAEEKINAGFLSQSEKPEKKENLAKWIRGNLFIPDARKFWIKPSIKFLISYLREHPVDIIISTGPPHSMHLIALGLKDKLNVPWIADFRDPWTKIDFYEELQLTKRADRKHHQLEKKVVQSADMVLSVTRSMRNDFGNLGAQKAIYLPNGFDPEDFPEENDVEINKFTILYIGALNQARNQDFFWKTVKEMIEENQAFAHDLHIELIGKTDISVHTSVEKYQLGSFVTITDYVSHNEIARKQKSAAILLLLINRTPHARGIVTGKIFEYIASGRPVLAIGPTDGEAAMILKETKTGTTVDYDDEEQLKITLTAFYDSFSAGNLKTNPENIHNYSRKTQTKQLADVLKNILSENNSNKTITT